MLFITAVIFKTDSEQESDISGLFILMVPDRLFF